MSAQISKKDGKFIKKDVQGVAIREESINSSDILEILIKKRVITEADLEKYD